MLGATALAPAQNRVQGRHAQQAVGRNFQNLARLVVGPHRRRVKREQDRLAERELQLRLLKDDLLAFLQSLRHDAQDGGGVAVGWLRLAPGNADVVGPGDAAADPLAARVP